MQFAEQKAGASRGKGKGKGKKYRSPTHVFGKQATETDADSLAEKDNSRSNLRHGLGSSRVLVRPTPFFVNGIWNAILAYESCGQLRSI